MADEFHVLLKCRFFKDERKTVLGKSVFRHANTFLFSEIMNTNDTRKLANLGKFIKIIASVHSWVCSIMSCIFIDVIAITYVTVYIIIWNTWRPTWRSNYVTWTLMWRFVGRSIGVTQLPMASLLRGYMANITCT